MQRRWFRIRSRPSTLLLGLLAAAFVVSIITYPDQAFQASLQGLRLWWDQVFPALLPVLVITEMVLGFGMMHALGVLLEPIMKRLFRLPGAAGWALAAGWIGGCPIGADATAKLRKRGDIGQAEAEQLLSLSHLCNPMLLIGVVGAGFLHSPEAGLILAIIHYASAAAAAIIQPLVSPPSEQRLSVQGPGPDSVRSRKTSGGWGARAYRAMTAARSEDGRAFGKLLGDAVSNSIQALMMVGGLMMIFSVTVRIVDIQASGIASSAWLQQLLPSLLEPHLGSFAISRLSELAPALRASCIGAAMAWSGFSLHAQVLALTKDTDIRYGPFIRFRLIHAAAAFLLTLPLWNPLSSLLQGTETVFSPDGGWARIPSELQSSWNLKEAAAVWFSLFMMLTLLLSLMLLASLAIRLLERSIARKERRL